MSGALRQLSIAPTIELVDASGASLFQTVYRPHRNFALDTQRLDFQPEPRFGYATACVVPRHGDLLTGAVLEFKLKKAQNASTYLGLYHPAEALVKEVQLIVNGQIVERHTNLWNRVFDHALRTPQQASHYRKLTNFDWSQRATTETLYLPLNFTFCRRAASALPLVLMSTAEVRINVVLGAATDAGVVDDTLELKLLAEYAYLDDPERRELVAKPRVDVLVEQVQYETFELPAGTPTSNGTTSATLRLNWARPVKAVFWAARNTIESNVDTTHYARFVGSDVPVRYTSSVTDPSGLTWADARVLSEAYAPIASSRLLFGGQERTAQFDGVYFNKYQPAMHAPRCLPAGLYMYSFALDPSQIDPSGVANFNTLDDVKLQLTFKKSADAANVTTEAVAANIANCSTVHAFALGYNVLRIERGSRAGLVWG